MLLFFYLFDNTVRFWWSLLAGVDWWDAVGCTQSAAEDGIGRGIAGDDILLCVVSAIQLVSIFLCLPVGS